ncbi:MAG: KpsF/GutQ family sugar-phosphate isomerase [Flavobacteriales bacterium]|nr:KpsF/GutQ family sugar-phosphate isomerase [Flavobacteriales bacterium]
MENFREIKENALKTLVIESDSVKNLVHFIDDDFVNAVVAILNSSGRLVVTGIGKSAIIGMKIVATLNSTGTPSLFMHAADALHGDLGMIQKNDVVLCISKSGETPEIKNLVPILKRGENVLIGMVGNISSYLAAQSDHIINTTVELEACPNNLAPTSSTTAQLAMGDAIAVCLLNARNFSSQDFAKYHPGGALGKQLYLTLRDFIAGQVKPEVSENESLRNIIIEINKGRVGATAVTKDGKVAGIITDGDIRRMLEKFEDLDRLKAKDIMSSQPVCLDVSCMAIEAATLMSSRKITQVIVTENGNYAGIVHFHDLNKEGIS